MPVPTIGSVPTPVGFQVESAQGVILLNWKSAVTATTYYVNRSTDNISFSNIGQTASLSYNDSSGVVGTIYHYQVQASNGTFSSVPTPSQAGMSLLPGQTTLGNIKLQAKQRCDRVDFTNMTESEWNINISNSYKELYDILVQKFGNDYFVAAPYTYVTASSQTLYPLPTDFYKLLGVDVALNGSDPTSYVSLRKFEFLERNKYNFPNTFTFYGVTNLRYRLNGNNLLIEPAPLGGQTIRITYSPRPNQLVNDTDLLDLVSGWEEYVIVDACIKAMVKEESDAQPFAMQKMALIKRIEEVAENRDVGEPETVSDSRSRNGWGDDSGFGGMGFF